MMMKKRLEQVMALMKERRAQRDARISNDEDMPLEKGDLKAMMISAFLVILPVALVALVVIVLLAGLMFWRR